MNYFEILGLEPHLSLDLQDLQQRFYRLSRQIHPDNFSLAMPAERARAEDETARLNDAYRTLRDPVTRAEYYLDQSGAGPRPAAASQAAPPPPDLLDYVFELNESLEALKSGDESVRPQIEQAAEHLKTALREADSELATLFDAVDARDPQAPADLRAALDRRRYLSKLLAQIQP